MRLLGRNDAQLSVRDPTMVPMVRRVLEDVDIHISLAVPCVITSAGAPTRVLNERTLYCI